MVCCLIKKIIQTILNQSSHIILIYRESIIDTYISNSKAKNSNAWDANHPNQSKYNNLISWNIDDFKKFAYFYRLTYNGYMKLLDISGKPYTIIKYEDIGNATSVETTLKQIFPDNLIKQSLMNKQSHQLNAADSFLNKEQYLMDIDKLNTSYSIDLTK